MEEFIFFYFFWSLSIIYKTKLKTIKQIDNKNNILTSQKRIWFHVLKLAFFCFSSIFPFSFVFNTGYKVDCFEKFRNRNPLINKIPNYGITNKTR